MSDIALTGSVSGSVSQGSSGADSHAATSVDLRCHRAVGSHLDGPTDNDLMECSSAARYLRKLRALPPVRSELVAAARKEIIAGTYSTDAKLDAAVAGLLDELVGGFPS